MRSADGSPRRRRAVFVGLAAGVIALVVVLVVLLGGSTRRVTPPVHAVPSPVSLGPVAQPPPRSEVFGVSVNRLFNDQFSGHGFSEAAIGAQLSALAATGATVARSDTLWQAAEPRPPVGGVHHYDWHFDDQIAEALAAHGLRWLPIVDYSASWASLDPSRGNAPPVRRGDYAAYAGALAERYGPGGVFWRLHPGITPLPVSTYEIWNEPDNAQFWYPKRDAVAYADLYVRARDAILHVDRTARAIVGGLTDIAHFLPAMVAARPGVAAHIDGVAIHPYGPNPNIVFSRVRGARSVLRQVGLAEVPLYVTEFGWTTQPAHSLGWAPAAKRPGYILLTLSALAHTDCRIAAVVLYTWVTPELNPADHEDWYGISPPGGGGSPDIAALTSALAAAAKPTSAVPLCAGAG